MIPQPLRLFAPEYAEPIDVTTCIDRFPPNDAPCPEKRGTNCAFPFCRCLFYTPETKEDE